MKVLQLNTELTEVGYDIRFEYCNRVTKRLIIRSRKVSDPRAGCMGLLKEPKRNY